MALPKWNDERVATLLEIIGDESPVSQDTVSDAAASLDTSSRSVSSKLRKMGHDVELAASAAKKAYSEEQETALKNLVVDNSGNYTYAEIAVAFDDGAFSAKSVQGKILSMELTSHVKAAEKKETVKTYSEEEEATFVKMSEAGDFAEDIAKALGRELNSIRGKGLSLLRAGRISEVPKQRDTVKKVDALEALGDISAKTIEDIAAEIEKTERGVKTMLTRRGLKCADYDGKTRKEKAAS